jgi:hypothetical protein
LDRANLLLGWVEEARRLGDTVVKIPSISSRVAAVALHLLGDIWLTSVSGGLSVLATALTGWRGPTPGLAIFPRSECLLASATHRREPKPGKEGGHPWISSRRGKPRALRRTPQLAKAVVTRALEEDEAAARAEWLAEFRSDLESYISPEVVARLIVPGVRERPVVDAPPSRVLRPKREGARAAARRSARTPPDAV